MPPRNKFTREEMIESAVSIVREKGGEALTARALAEKLGCSAKPIFGLFKNMEDVKRSVISEANRLFSLSMENEMKSGKYPPYKAAGMGYIRFAREEKELYKLLFMRDRSGEKIENDDSFAPIVEIMQKKLGLSPEDARLFHAEMWIFVHGMASMTAADYLPWDDDFADHALTDIFEGLKHRFLTKEKTKEKTKEENKR